ncbi:MAG: divalent-cation tolerance protein CutA [Methanosarcinaceae archaeon]|nr:divalent-cation tolerance protein CutA [Methanosarcinaceae archaeon]NKQ38876.1 divalent-cation tolerance protein CutA [Methanosarcinales archaeon]
MFSIIYTTTSTKDEAKKIAKALVKEKLAACVNIFPIYSIYEWDGIQENDEFALLIKTTTKTKEKIEKRIKEMHEYETPCIISFNIDGGSIDFLEWIKLKTI